MLRILYPDTTYVCFWYAKKFDWRQLSVLGVLFYSIPQKSYICYDNRPSTLPDNLVLNNQLMSHFVLLS